MNVYRAPAWIDVTEFVGNGTHWHLTDAWDVPQKAAQVHVIAFLENGDPAYDALANLFNDFGINIRLGLEHKQYDQAIADFTLGHGEFFNPDKGERGVDQVRMLGFQSDIVTGIGLPMADWEYFFVFQLKSNGVPIPPPPATNNARVVADALRSAALQIERNWK